ncbi:hypothetical protein [Streptomyces sp. AC602_WCS936]|uniref:hypothetical protein n=1 Tax=Streptomyces sp. AC602_WCS936 TaxID=2823685 RepID=UPI001C26ABE3|nr:hypothetical protein [Streptomyces sp. AC602_WCS936]
MKKIVFAGVPALALLLAAPAAHANTGPALGGTVDAASDWAFSTATVCLQEVAIVPQDGKALDHVNHCLDGNVIDTAER